MKLKLIEKDKKVFFIIVLIALLFGTFNDLGLSVFLYQTNTVFGRIFENHILLLVFVPVIYSSIALYFVKKNYVSLCIASLISLYAGFMNVKGYIPHFWTRCFTAIGLGCILFAGLFLFVGLTKREKLSNNATKYFKVLAVFLAVVVAIHTIKFLNGRIRFRDFSEQVQYHDFSYWYQFKLFGKGNSFPSGHTATLYVLLPILTMFQKNEFRNRIFVYLLVALMAIARIRIGAHFLSDTAFALIIAVSIDILFQMIGEKHFESTTASL